MPTPSKKSPKKSYYPGLGPENSPLSPSRSVDSGLNKKEWVFATPEKPVGGYKKDRKVLGSIERGLDKMKNMLTPRKHETVHRPSVITGKYNLFRLFPIISISQKNFSIFFLTLEKIGIDEKVICYHNISN